MNTLFIGKNFIHLKEVDSTNSFASGLLSEQAPEGTVISADWQSAGKGQRNAVWKSNAGCNLMLSVILYPRFLSPQKTFDLNRMVSLSVWETVHHFLPDRSVNIKWPNDILVDGKKIAGILLENQLEASRVRSAVAGIGMNVLQKEFPDGFKRRPTSVSLESSKTIKRETIRDFLFERMERNYLKLRSGQMASIDKNYLHALYRYQEDADYRIGGHVYKGRIIGVERSGRLALEIDQKLKYFTIKEVEFCP